MNLNKQIVDLYFAGNSLRNIERLLGIDRKKASKILKQNNVSVKSLNGNSGYNKYIVFEKAEPLFLQGRSIKSLSKEFNFTPLSFSNWLKSKGHVIKRKNNIVQDLTSKLILAENYYLQGNSIIQSAKKAQVNNSTFSDYLFSKGYDTFLRSKSYFIDDAIFENIDNEEKAYWLGFLYADGYVSDTNKKYLQLFLKESDYDHIRKFQDFLKTNSPIKKKVVKLNDKQFISYGITIVNKKICNDLINLGCIPNKSLKLVFPNEKILPKKFINHFVRGYFDGDGTIFVSKDKKLSSFTILGTKNFLQTIRSIYQFTDTKWAINGKAFGTRHGGNKATYLFLSQIYEGSTIYLDRKYQKYLSFLIAYARHD